jgi:hypothetical protein
LQPADDDREDGPMKLQGKVAVVTGAGQGMAGRSRGCLRKKARR